MSYTTGRFAWVKSNEAKTPKGALKTKTESQTLAASNENRVSLYVVNNGTKPLWLAFGATAVADEGIRLNENGGAIIISDYTGIVTAISKEAEPVACFIEV